MQNLRMKEQRAWQRHKVTGEKRSFSKKKKNHYTRKVQTVNMFSIKTKDVTGNKGIADVLYHFSSVIHLVKVNLGLIFSIFFCF